MKYFYKLNENGTINEIRSIQFDDNSGIEIETESINGIIPNVDKIVDGKIIEGNRKNYFTEITKLNVERFALTRSQKIETAISQKYSQGQREAIAFNYFAIQNNPTHPKYAEYLREYEEYQAFREKVKNEVL